MGDFLTKIRIGYNFLVLYIWNTMYSLTRTNIEEQVVLDIHNFDSHSIIDYQVDKKKISLVVENPIIKENNVISVYDVGLDKDLTKEFSRFSNYYCKDTHTFQHLDKIKAHLKTSDNILIIDDSLDEWVLPKY